MQIKILSMGTSTTNVKITAIVITPHSVHHTVQEGDTNEERDEKMMKYAEKVKERNNEIEQIKRLHLGNADLTQELTIDD